MNTYAQQRWQAALDVQARRAYAAERRAERLHRERASRADVARAEWVAARARRHKARLLMAAGLPRPYAAYRSPGSVRVGGWPWVARIQRAVQQGLEPDHNQL